MCNYFIFWFCININNIFSIYFKDLIFIRTVNILNKSYLLIEFAQSTALVQEFSCFLTQCDNFRNSILSLGSGLHRFENNLFSIKERLDYNYTKYNNTFTFS